ncbi:MAG: hypothetical protein AAF514_11385, partial [Verrucomicrobiota bacterium]
LATNYREPVLKAIICEGIPRREAEDLTQQFFSEIVFGKEDEPSAPLFAKADQKKGQLRSFIYISLKHFLGGDLKKGSQKTGQRHPPQILGGSNQSGSGPQP